MKRLHNNQSESNHKINCPPQQNQTLFTLFLNNNTAKMKFACTLVLLAQALSTTNAFGKSYLK